MASKTIKLTGEASWAKLQQPDEYLGVERWTINLAMDDKSLETFKASGSRLKVKEDNAVSIKKTVDAPNNWKGSWEAPTIKYKDSVDPDLVIGNGSTVECSVEVYDTKYGKGTRLNSVKVLELIPYVTDAPEETPETPEDDDGKDPWS